MSEAETIFLALLFLLLVAILGYWGNLAWFQPEKFMQRIRQDDEGGRNRLLFLRVVTLVGTLSILYLGILVLLSLQGVRK